MPYRSNAQRKKFHAMEERGEISHKTVAEFDKASKGMHLPEHVKKHAHGGYVCHFCGGEVSEDGQSHHMPEHEEERESFAQAIRKHR